MTLSQLFYSMRCAQETRVYSNGKRVYAQLGWVFAQTQLLVNVLCTIACA